MIRRVRLKGHVLPIDLHVLVGSYQEAQVWVDRRFGPGWQLPGCAACAFVAPAPTGQGWECVIWMPHFRNGNAFDAGKLAHEALHIVWRLLEHLGIYDEETHCYLLQWIIDETTHRLKRQCNRRL